MKYEIKIIKEEHHWTSDKKIKFLGYGEWVEEIDLLEFEYKGYLASVVRVLKKETYAKQEAYFGGHFCGYVEIPEAHPFFNDKQKCYDLDCHGGITYNKFDKKNHIGFDCAHIGDYVPSMEHLRKTMPEQIQLSKDFPLPEGYEKFALFNPSYKNMEFCIGECKSLIDQLIEAETLIKE